MVAERWHDKAGPARAVSAAWSSSPARLMVDPSVCCSTSPPWGWTRRASPGCRARADANAGGTTVLLRGAERAARAEHGDPRRRPRGRPGAPGGAGRRAAWPTPRSPSCTSAARHRRRNSASPARRRRRTRPVTSGALPPLRTVSALRKLARRRLALESPVMAAEGLDHVVLYGANRSGSAVPGSRSARSPARPMSWSPAAPDVLLVSFYNHVPEARRRATEADVRFAGDDPGRVRDLLQARGAAGRPVASSVAAVEPDAALADGRRLVDLSEPTPASAAQSEEEAAPCGTRRR